jgi:hypothetical protein
LSPHRIYYASKLAQSRGGSKLPHSIGDEVFYEYWGFGDGVDAEVKKIQKEVKASRR